MVAPIFQFRNIQVAITDTNPTFIYGVVAYNGSVTDRTLADGVGVTEVSTVVLTVQVSNKSATEVTVSAYVQRNTGFGTLDTNLSRTLVKEYPLMTNNAFDPLSGNLVLTANDQLWVQVTGGTCDVVVSLLEIANATAT
jgi:hypothetical protein